MPSCQADVLRLKMKQITFSPQHNVLNASENVSNDVKKKKLFKANQLPFAFSSLRRSVESQTSVVSCALRSGRREIPDLLLYLWLCAPCVRHQIYIVGPVCNRLCLTALVKNKYNLWPSFSF